MFLEDPLRGNDGGGQCCMPTLSVIMIVKNESDCLADCLASVRTVADEIIVGDTGSTDNTKAIARAHDARVIDVPWSDDFAAARNATIAAATGDWLLHMDADEVLDDTGGSAIRALVDADGDGADAIELTLANYCNEPRSWRWVVTTPDDPHARGFGGYLASPLLRLFRSGNGFEYREAIHENITDSVIENGGIIRSLPVLVHHYGYSASGPKAERKKSTYLALCRKKAEERTTDPKAWHDLAEQLLSTGNESEAASACARVLELEPSHLGASTTMANLYMIEGRLDEAKSILERLDAAGHTEPHVATALAAIALRHGHTAEAITLARRATAEAIPNVMGMLTLARALDVVGDAEQARDVLDAARAAVPTFDECGERIEAWKLRTEGEAFAGADDFESALAKFLDALRLDSDDPVTHNDVGVVLHQLGEMEKAKVSFERALKLAPGLEPARQNLGLI